MLGLDKFKKRKETGEGNAEDRRKKILRMCGRILVLAVILGFVIWYFRTPSYYIIEEENKTLFTNKRTYIVLMLGALLSALVMAPNKLSDRVNRILGWIWFALSPFVIYYTLYHMNAMRFHIRFMKLNRIAVSFTFIFLYLVLLLVLLILGSVRWSVVIVSVAVMLIGIVNWFVIDFRGQAISGADLFSLGTALSVAGEFEYNIDWHVYSEIFLVFATCVFSLKIRKFRAFKLPSRLAVLCIWLVMTGGYYHICCRTSFLEDHNIRSRGFSHQNRYDKFDMLFTTLCTCFYLAADKPDGYSLEKVQEIASAYTEPEEGDTGAGPDEEFNTPNLIVILNESFADYMNIGKGLTLSKDCMPFIHGLKKNTIKGTAYVSIFGGNTPNTEYEFLTGNTMGFLPTSSVGFNLFVRGKMPSIVSELESAGYETLAMHPYRGTNFRRHIVYPQLGFDRYLTIDDFEDPEYIRSYISDQEFSERIMKEYREHDENSEAPFLSYNVTMQNHGGYTLDNTEGIPWKIEVQNPEVNQTRTSIYVNLIRESDRVFKKLVKHFKKVEEPVVILMFGDHQASLGDSTYDYLLGKTGKDLTPEEQMEKYKVPFVCWANYDIEEEVIEKTSMNYLYSIIADRIGLPLTGYQEYLLDLSEEIPVITAGGYWTADGDFYELNDKTSPYFDRINEYNILEYNCIFGKDDRDMDLFSLSF